MLNQIANDYHTKVEYPMAEFIIVFGFFLVLITEQIVLDCKERSMTNSSKQGQTHTTDSENSERYVAQFSHNGDDESSSLIETTAESTSTNSDDQHLINKSSIRGRSNRKIKPKRSYGSTGTSPVQHNNADVIIR